MPVLPEPSWPLSNGVVPLRRFTLEDVADVTRACQDPEIARWTASIPWPYEEQHARYRISRHDAAWTEGTSAPFACCSATTGEFRLVDRCGRDRLGPAHGDGGVLGGTMGPQRGKYDPGLRLVCDWGFGAADLRSIDLMTKIGNVASERVAEKAGFVVLGTIAQYEPARAVDPDVRHEVKHWIRRS